MQLDRDGARLFPAAFGPAEPAALADLLSLPRDRPGARLGATPGLAEAGDVWACATPILHASERAASPVRRRVLQLLYSAEALPGGLAWS